MTRDFLGVTICAFVVATDVVFRISPVGNTPLPIPQPTSENAGAMLVVLLLLLLVLLLPFVCFTFRLAFMVDRAVLRGCRDLSLERSFLASLFALRWCGSTQA